MATLAKVKLHTEPDLISYIVCLHSYQSDRRGKTISVAEIFEILQISMSNFCVRWILVEK